MTSYFEKLTSINTSSLNLVSTKFQSSSQPGDLNSALERIDQLKELNTKLELDLKCEHDEKVDLVGLKVGLESEILELREVNERLQFQVDNLKEEKDKIHHVLAKMKEDLDERRGLFIASSGGAAGGVMKKFPSLDDLTLPSTSPPTDRPSITPTSSTSYTHLERIEEQDELESLAPTEPKQPLDQLQKRIQFLEQENDLLRRGCTKCRQRKPPNPSGNVIFEHEDEGLVLSAVDDEDEDEERNMSTDPGDEEQINLILDMQRKIIEKLEGELFRGSRGRDLRDEVNRMKVELERRMERIVRRVGGGDL